MLWAVFAAVWAASFVALECFVIATGRPTLSQTMWDLGHQYPLFAALVGAAFGGLLVHFFDWR